MLAVNRSLLKGGRKKNNLERLRHTVSMEALTIVHGRFREPHMDTTIQFLSIYCHRNDD
jgi:hypothetical protein